MRSAKPEGQKLGKTPLNIDRETIVRDRLSGLSLMETVKRHKVSRATVVRLAREAGQHRVSAAA